MRVGDGRAGVTSRIEGRIWCLRCEMTFMYQVARNLLVALSMNPSMGVSEPFVKSDRGSSWRRYKHRISPVYHLANTFVRLFQNIVSPPPMRCLRDQTSLGSDWQKYVPHHLPGFLIGASHPKPSPYLIPSQYRKWPGGNCRDALHLCSCC